MIRMDQVFIPLKDFAYTITQPNGEMEVSLEKIRSRCAANALVRAGYLKKTDTGYAVADSDRFQALEEELCEKTNKAIDKPAGKGGK